MNRTETRRTATSVEFPPTLAIVVGRCLTVLDARRPDLARLAQIVELDPVLTGTALRIVRCPIYGAQSPSAPARTVESIGRKAMERMLRSQRTLGADFDADVVSRRWTHAIAVAAASRWISNQGMYEGADEAYLAGLVHDIGRLVAPAGEASRSCAVRAAGIVEAWRLGPRVAAVTRWHHAINEGVSVDSLVVDGAIVAPGTARLLTAVARGDLLATALGFGDDERLAAPGQAEDPDTANVREAIELELLHAASILGMPRTPSAQFAATLARHELRAREQLAGAAPAQAVAARSVSAVATLHRDILDTHGMTAVPDLLDRGLREIHEKLEFDRLMLIEPDPAKEMMLRARLAFDPTRLDLVRGTSGIEFPLEPGGAIALAVETDRACCGGDPELDRETLRRLGVASFAAAPLRAGGTNLGVVVADQCFTGRTVTEDDAAILAMMCSTLGLTLENAALDAASKLLRSLAEKDELTGINNRRNILAMLQHEIDRARRYGKPLSLAMVDVDHFKTWNDLHGHQVGDQILQSVAQLISSCSREFDTFGRYGGEEFLIVLPETPVDHAVLYSERLRATIENHGETLRAQYPDSSLSVSIGLSSLCLRGDDADRIIHRADSALYAAKKHGRNRVCVEMPMSEGPRPPSPTVRGVLDEI